MNNFGMSDSKKSKILTISLIIVIIAILILLGFWGYSEYKKISLQADAADAAEVFDVSSGKKNNIDDASNTYANVAPPDFSGMTTTTGGTNTTKQLYKGFVMVGYIEIPKTGIKYPVLEEVNKKSIETSVAILYGPGLNKVGNTVIVGHNYRQPGVFFSDNAKIAVGDKIYITDATGSKLSYTVYNTYVTTPEDAEYMTRDTKGAIEISLSTCTDDSSARLIIEARE